MTADLATTEVTVPEALGALRALHLACLRKDLAPHGYPHAPGQGIAEYEVALAGAEKILSRPWR